MKRDLPDGTVRRSLYQRGDAQRLDLFALSWRMKGPTGAILSCGIFRDERGLEVLCAHGPADLSRSQVTREIGTARRNRGTVAAGGAGERGR